MTTSPDRATADDEIRTRWRDLVHKRLPDAATTRDWPVSLDHCFARILLDDACDGPWRDTIAPPAWRNAPAALLTGAIERGEAVLAGELDLHALNRRSLALRGKREPRGSHRVERER